MGHIGKSSRRNTEMKRVIQELLSRSVEQRPTETGIHSFRLGCAYNKIIPEETSLVITCLSQKDVYVLSQTRAERVASIVLNEQEMKNLCTVYLEHHIEAIA